METGCAYHHAIPLCLQIRVIKRAFDSVNLADRISEMFPQSSSREEINIIP
jgi:hypothetical protein